MLKQHSTYITALTKPNTQFTRPPKSHVIKPTDLTYALIIAKQKNPISTYSAITRTWQACRNPNTHTLTEVKAVLREWRKSARMKINVARK